MSAAALPIRLPVRGIEGLKRREGKGRRYCVDGARSLNDRDCFS